MKRVPKIRTTRRGKLSDSEARDANRELTGIFEEAQHVNRKYEVRFSDGPLQGHSVETTEPQSVVSLLWPPKQLDPDGNEPKVLLTYRKYDENKKKGIIRMRIDRRPAE